MKQSKGSNKTRILLVDHHPLIRQALRNVISHVPDLEVCGEASDRQSTRSAIRAGRPDLAITELTPPGSSGFSFIKEVRCSYPKVRILVYSACDEEIYTERAIRAGANGYLSKRDDGAKVIEAVRTIMRGDIFWNTRAALAIASKLLRPERTRRNSPVAQLSERELEVFELIGDGCSTVGIARRLFVSASTVESHRSRIKDKLGLKTGVELLQSAIQWNLIRAAGQRTAS